MLALQTRGKHKEWEIHRQSAAFLPHALASSPQEQLAAKAELPPEPQSPLSPGGTRPKTPQERRDAFAVKARRRNAARWWCSGIATSARRHGPHFRPVRLSVTLFASEVEVQVIFYTEKSKLRQTQR